MDKLMKPLILFKYFSPNRHTFFDKPLLRFTPPSELNDPFEGKASFKGIASQEYIEAECNANFDKIFEEEMLAKGIPKQSFSSNQWEILKKNIDSIMMRDGLKRINSREVCQKLNETPVTAFNKAGIGILSLSKLRDNPLMWAHYCQEHKGFVVGFDTSHSFFDRRLDDQDVFRSLKPVTYITGRPSKYLADYSPDEAIKDLLCTKSEDWEYEAEWRMIIAGVSSMTQYGVPGLDAIPVDAVREVYLGVKADQKLKNCAASFCREHAVKIYQMELHETDYTLQAVQINP